MPPNYLQSCVCAWEESGTIFCGLHISSDSQTGQCCLPVLSPIPKLRIALDYEPLEGRTMTSILESPRASCPVWFVQSLLMSVYFMNIYKQTSSSGNPQYVLSILKEGLWEETLFRISANSFFHLWVTFPPGVLTSEKMNTCLGGWVLVLVSSAILHILPPPFIIWKSIFFFVYYTIKFLMGNHKKMRGRNFIINSKSWY